jgi:hypothetical protein
VSFHGFSSPRRESADRDGEPFPETWERGLKLLVRLKKWLEENGGDAAADIHERFGYTNRDTQRKRKRGQPAAVGRGIFVPARTYN